MTTKNRTCIIAVVYSEDRVEKFRKLLRGYADFLETKHIIFISNNKNLDGSRYTDYFTSSGFTAEYALHDNTGAEFGAYQRGLDMARQQGTNVYIFINDTAGIHNFLGHSFVASLKSLMTDASLSAWCFGISNVAPRRFVIGDVSSNRWIQSHFFAMDSAALEAIEHTIYAPEINSLVSESPDPALFLANLSDKALRSYVEGWLFSESGSRWYGAEPLSQDNFRRFALKARSILQEKYLSMRMDSSFVAFHSPHAKLPRRVVEKFARRLFKLHILG